MPFLPLALNYARSTIPHHTYSTTGVDLASKTLSGRESGSILFDFLAELVAKRSDHSFEAQSLRVSGAVESSIAERRRLLRVFDKPKRITNALYCLADLVQRAGPISCGRRDQDGRKGAVAESFDEPEPSTDCFFVRCGVVVVSICCFAL